jgi:predicted DNA-binding transcriptional regulator AlpA
MRVDSRDNANDDALLLSASQAARLLGIGRKTLWNHTAKPGEPVGDKIPAVRIGRVVRYRRATLERWIAEREGGGDGF